MEDFTNIDANIDVNSLSEEEAKAKIDEAVVNALERIQAAYKAKGTVTGIPTGFTDLDFKTSGFQPSDLILIAARPSMGKTALVLNIASHMALKENKGLC